MFKRAALAACLALAIPASAQGNYLAGNYTVIDGDTMMLEGRSVRLQGIDAPESDQSCERGGASWNCGAAATDALASLVTGERVTCSIVGQDAYGRDLGVCASRSFDLNATMVEEGWAVAYRTYSAEYVPQEVRAKAARKGIWSSQFTLPEFHRSAQRNASSTQAVVSDHDGSCTIKGNRNRKGQWIYHLPWMPYYAPTRAEDIFCTEAAARAAGYRRAIVR